jgi:hypothetical protein
MIEHNIQIVNPIKSHPILRENDEYLMERAA